jgi:hypothetical protein
MALRTSTLSLLVLALGASAFTIPACAPGSGAESNENDSKNGSEVTGSLPVGTVLIATADVNLRKGPSSSYGIIDVVPDGASVTVVVSSPQNGYYDVKFGTETGWTSGQYYKLGSGSTSSSTGSTSSSSTSSSTGSSSGAGGSSTSSSATGSSSSGSSNASSSGSSGGTSCTVSGVEGTCIDTSTCAAMTGYHSTAGFCPGAADIECCTPTSTSSSTSTSTSSSSSTSSSGGTSCEANGVEGTCIDTSTCATMTGYVSTPGLCPGAADIECCTQSGSSSSGGETSWTCTGLYGTIPEANGQYYATEFGCYVDGNGNVQTDPGDNCIPACLSQAQSSGLCAGMSGPECEESVNWYAADGGRFGCLARLMVTNEANGNAVVVVALDYGPACSVEATVSHAAIDLSYPADDYLFGGETGISDEALVHVEVVDASTPLGVVR